MMKTILITLILLLTIPISACTSVVSTQPTVDIEPPWWKTAVFYEIFVRSFYDSDGDGIGDIKGMTEKLDYLNDGNTETDQDLGITGIWLMPINPSPSYHGYDIVDYYEIDPEYGTMDDFQLFLKEAHARGIKVIIDLVLNHTSSEHPFFKEASANPNSDYRDWYIWSAENKGNHWHALPGANGVYYYGYFSDGMPDLNYQNAEVTAEMEKVVAYWLKDVGVDGFRIDAAKHLIEEGNTLENTELTHTWFSEFYPFYKGINPDAYVVGEVSGSTARITTTYNQEEMDEIFNFELASSMVSSAAGESASSINSGVTFTLQESPDWNFATFLTNHDQNRIMSQVGGIEGRAKIAASMLLIYSGTPFIYYGEEIGMEGVKPDEDIRLPMQWDSSENGGFSKVTPWRQLDDFFTERNVATEVKDDSSLLNHYKRLIRLRQEHPALSQGDYLPLSTSNPRVYAGIKKNSKETLLIVMNLSKSPINDFGLSYSGSEIEKGRYTLEGILGAVDGASISVKRSGFSDFKPLVELEPYSTYIYSIKK